MEPRSSQPRGRGGAVVPSLPRLAPQRERILLMRLPAAPLILLGAMVVLLFGGGVALAKTITGTNGPDTLIGTASPDQISALRGGDYVDGMQGDDALYGNQGNDRVLGRGGKDRMAGGLHRDVLLGGSANDTIRAVDGYEEDRKSVG